MGQVHSIGCLKGGDNVDNDHKNKNYSAECPNRRTIDVDSDPGQGARGEGNGNDDVGRLCHRLC